MLAAAALAAFILTFHRNPWQGPDWPRYGTVFEGRVLVFSTLWRRGPGWAWMSDGWIYDSRHIVERRWYPVYVRFGDSYSGTPAYTAWLHAVSVPFWWFALPLLGASVCMWRKGGRIGRRVAGVLCAGCGYALIGLPEGRGRCPECGMERGG